jgi:chorismate lyase / 3-hydroxybenzoate synthase
VAQTRETLRNIEALLDGANRGSGAEAPFAISDLRYKAYVRHPADQPLIERELRAAFGDSVRVLYLHAELCRQDLSVEIEATGVHFANGGA